MGEEKAQALCSTVISNSGFYEMRKKRGTNTHKSETEWKQS